MHFKLIKRKGTEFKKLERWFALRAEKLTNYLENNKTFFIRLIRTFGLNCPEKNSIKYIKFTLKFYCLKELKLR